MASTTNPEPDLPTAEELVAYLDGELAPDDCRRVEARLAEDAAYRAQLQELDRAWEALEVLPASSVNADFARTTIEMVTIAAQGEASATANVTRAARRRRAIWMLAVGFIAGALAFALAWFLGSRPNRQLLANLPIIWQVDVLAQVPSAEFLRRLSDSGTLEEMDIEEPAIQRELEHLAWARAPKRSAREDWIGAMAVDERSELAAKASRYALLERDPAEHQRVRRLYDELTHSDDTERLMRTLIVYGAWLARLTPGEQEQLREDIWDLPAQEQVERIERAIRRQRNQATYQLPGEDAERLRREATIIADQRRGQLLAELRRRDAREAARRLEGPSGTLRIVTRELMRDGGALRERLTRVLSDETQAHLERLSGWRRGIQLWQWLRDSLQLELSQEELQRFFAEELSNDQRERLLNLSTTEMQAELERMYLASELRPAPSERANDDARVGADDRAGAARDRAREAPPRRPRAQRPGRPKAPPERRPD